MLLSRLSSQFSRPAFFSRSFFWALLQANSCVLQLRVFCFPGSALTHHWVPSHKAAARFGSSSPRFWVPQKNGAEKGDIFHVLLELSNNHRICWSRSRAASIAEQRFKIHRSFRRHATLLEKRRGRMGLESRVASRRDISPSAGSGCS